MAYAVSGDLDWGGMPAPGNIDHWLNKAADEIDSKIGSVYVTPVVLLDTAEQRPGKLLLNRINSWLAMGRAILARATPNEDDQLHQLGLYYVTEATNALDKIVDGTVILAGATLVTETTDKQTGPMAASADESSIVEGYSGAFGNPLTDAMNRQTQLPSMGNFYLSPYTW